VFESLHGSFSAQRNDKDMVIGLSVTLHLSPTCFS
jgi:hypothetical protein